MLILVSDAFSLQLKTYKEHKRTKEGMMLIKTHLLGAGEAWILTNEWLKQKGKSPLFCAPKHIIAPETFLEIIDQKTRKLDKILTIQEKKKFDFEGTPILLMVLDELMKEYPCKSQ